MPPSGLMCHRAFPVQEHRSARFLPPLWAGEILSLSPNALQAQRRHATDLPLGRHTREKQMGGLLYSRHQEDLKRVVKVTDPQHALVHSSRTGDGCRTVSADPAGVSVARRLNATIGGKAREIGGTTMTTEPSGQSEFGVGQKPPSEGREDPFDPSIVWPWEETDGEPIDVEVTDDQIEENLADEAAPLPF